MGMQKRPDKLPRDAVQNKLKRRVLDRRVMTGLVDGLGDLIALYAGWLIFRYIARRDYAGRITAAGRRDGVVEGIPKIILEFDDRLGR